MKNLTAEILVAGGLLCATVAAQPLQPEVFYSFLPPPPGAAPEASLVQGSVGNLYGTTAAGGAYSNLSGKGFGTVFTMTTNGILTTLVSFDGTNGANPQAELVQGSDGTLYGTTSLGGSSNYGTVFKVTTNGLLTTLVSFTGANGANPTAGLVWRSDGSLYGTTQSGGTSGYGTVFKVTTNGVLTTLVSFTGDNGASPYAALVQGSDGNLYGTTALGGSGHGTVFKVTTNGYLTTLVFFDYDTNGANPLAGLVLDSSGNLYGTTAYGGSMSAGTVFQLATNGVLTTLFSFNGINGGLARGLALANDGNLYGTTSWGGSRGTVFKITPNGVLTTLVSFTGANGASPLAGLALGTDGNLYGTTAAGGSTGNGTVFKMTTEGVFTTLVSFPYPSRGEGPSAGLILGGDGNFYGTTGGSSDHGMVFKLTTNGLLTTLVSFDGTNGEYLHGRLVFDSSGNLYGTTAYGGSNHNGTVFKLATNGVLSTLVSFDRTNGAFPWAGLALGIDGNFYGTTRAGGTSDCGTIFKMTPDGRLTTLASTPWGGYGRWGTGAEPWAELALGNDGNFYGSAYLGGLTMPLDGRGGTSNGTLFKLTTNGIVTTLVLFDYYTNGANPATALVLGKDGNFYGTTPWGGSGRRGTVFQVTTNGVLTTLVSFNGTNGAFPYAALVQGSDGSLYGTTVDGGGSYVDNYQPGHGTVFKVTTNGILTTLVSFTGANGQSPGGLVVGSDGNFCGVAVGPDRWGMIFRLSMPAEFTSLTRLITGSVSLTSTGPTNRACRLWTSTDCSLPLASWKLLTSNSFDLNGNFSFMDVGAATNNSGFYRLTVP